MPKSPGRLDAIVKKKRTKSCRQLELTEDNVENMRRLIGCFGNILVCGNRGVGKITNSVKAVADRKNVFYMGNPVDHEGKGRPGSYEKYVHYVMSLKKDLAVIDDAASLVSSGNEVIVIIDEIFGRSDEQLKQIGALFDAKNVRVVQIVGCIKYMGPLIDKVDVIVEMHPDGAFTIDKEFGKAICSVLAKTIEEKA